MDEILLKNSFLVLIEWFRLMRPFITGGRRYNHSLKGDHDHLIEVTTKKS